MYFLDAVPFIDDRQQSSGSIQPGEAMRGYVGFSIPPSAKPAALYVTSPLGDDYGGFALS